MRPNPLIATRYVIASLLSLRAQRRPEPPIDGSAEGPAAQGRQDLTARPDRGTLEMTEEVRDDEPVFLAGRRRGRRVGGEPRGGRLGCARGGTTPHTAAPGTRLHPAGGAFRVRVPRTGLPDRGAAARGTGPARRQRRPGPGGPSRGTGRPRAARRGTRGSAGRRVGHRGPGRGRRPRTRRVLRPAD